MSEITHRVLRLLGLLESRSTWTGSELAERLGVTQRTVRRDVIRLRELGYQVDSVQGLDGGYRMSGGRALPPLVLDDDEAVALTACLRMAAMDGSDQIGEAALRALAKLDQVLPARIRPEVAAVSEAVTTLPSTRPGISWQPLAALAKAKRDHRLARINYVRGDGEESERDVEPAQLLTQAGKWYLIAFDRLRSDWRIFRLDRMNRVQVLTFTFTPRTPPSPRDMLLGRRPENWPHEAVVTLTCPSRVLEGRIPERHFELLEDNDGVSTLRVGADEPDHMAWHLVGLARSLGAELRVVRGDSLRTALAGLATEFAEAAQSSSRSTTPSARSRPRRVSESRPSDTTPNPSATIPSTRADSVSVSTPSGSPSASRSSSITRSTRRSSKDSTSLP